MLGSGRANDGNFASWWHPSPGWEAREADRDDGAFRLTAQKHAGLPGAAGGDHHPVAVEEALLSTGMHKVLLDVFEVKRAVGDHFVEVFHEHRFRQDRQFLQGTIHASPVEALVER